MPGPMTRPLRRTAAPNRAAVRHLRRIHKTVIANENLPARRRAGGRRRQPSCSREIPVFQRVAGCAERAMLRVAHRADERARIRIDRFARDNETYREQSGAVQNRPGPLHIRRNDLIWNHLFETDRPAGGRRAAWVPCCTAQTEPRRRPGRLLVPASPASGVPSRSRLPPRAPPAILTAARPGIKCRCRPTPCPPRMRPRGARRARPPQASSPDWVAARPCRRASHVPAAGSNTEYRCAGPAP